ncbi:MAG: exosortase-associated protein EpsI, B-type [Nitrosospira sp.]
MNLWLRNFVLLMLMLAASGLALALRPTHKFAEQGPAVDLQAMIPLTFGEWREEQQNSAQIVDPQQQETIDKIYTQTLNRTYVNTSGYRIMLAIAYGDDQRDSMQTHYPEVCYPAQGFELLSRQSASMTSSMGSIPIMQLVTSLEKRRVEPVTYWVMIGDVPITSGLRKKLAEMRYGLNGMIPDGLLFRVSSIDQDNLHAFTMHQSFITDILTAIPPSERRRLSGI